MSTWDFEVGPDDPAKRDEKAREARTERGRNALRAGPSRPRERRTSRDPMAMAGPRALERGEIVKGVVVEATADGVLVDVGAKAEGLIPMYEFTDRSEIPGRDEEIEVAVVRIEEDDGTPILSKKSADYERVWNRIISAQETGEILDAMVLERVKGGLRVDLGVPGFVPASHVATRDVRNLDRFVGRSLRLKVLEANRGSKKVVLSHRLVVEEERRQRREQTLAQLQEGLVCEGKVRSLTKYGAFIDLGGVDGLLHVSEMCWGRVEHPSDVLQVGDTVRVMVLEIDHERDRISLGRRQILPDPWKAAAEKIRLGSLVQGTVTRVVRTGAFVELKDLGIEGFIPMSELSDKRVAQASDAVSEGDEVTVQVLKMRAEARRMTLSLRAAEQEKERQEYQEYIAGQERATVTLGDQFADVLGAVAGRDEEGGGEAAEDEPAPPAEATSEQQPVAEGEPVEVAEAGAAQEAEAAGEDDSEESPPPEEDAESADQKSQ